MLTRHALIALTALTLLPACPKRGDESSATPETTRAPLARAESPPLTLTPVAEPEDVIMRARIESPAAIFDALVSIWGQAYDWRAKLNSTDEKILRFVDLDAPLDFVLTLNQDLESEDPVLFAFSIGGNSVDDIAEDMSERGPMREIAPGVFRNSLTEDKSIICEVGPSRDAAGGRVVCSSEPEVLDLLGPYMRRGEFQALPLASSFQTSFDFEPIRVRFRPEFTETMQGVQIMAGMGVAGLADADFREAGSTALRATFDEIAHLYDDLGTMSLELEVGGPEGGLQIGVDVHMAGKKAYLSRLLLSGKEQMAPPSAAFWALPASASSASFVHSELLPETVVMGAVVRELLLGAAREYDYPVKKLEKALDLFGTMAKDASTGEVLMVTFPGVPADPAWPEELRKVAENFDALVVSSPRMAGDMKSNKAWAQVYNDRAFQKKLKQVVPDGKSLPKLSWKKAKRGDKLPVGSYEMRLTLPRDWLPEESKAKKGLALSYFVVPTKDRLVVGLSFDRKATLEALRAVLSPSGPTLADDPVAQRFRAMKVTRGGWSSMTTAWIDKSVGQFSQGGSDAILEPAQLDAIAAWRGDWEGKSIPAATSWSSVEGLGWHSVVRFEPGALQAMIDLLSRLAATKVDADPQLAY